MSKYNGWTNYATWCMHLHITSDEIPYNYARWLATSADDSDDRAKVIETWITEEVLPTFSDTWYGVMVSDLISSTLSDVNWQEIADAFLEE